MSQANGKAMVSKPDASRLMSIWLDQVCDDDTLPASAFKLAYRIAKWCRVTCSKKGVLYCYERQDRLAMSAAISEKQLGNLLKLLVERGHLRVIRHGKGLTNWTVPIVGDRQYIADHNEDSDPQSSSPRIGNGVPIHIKGNEEVVGGEGFQPSPSLPSTSPKIDGNIDDARLMGASADPGRLEVGQVVDVDGFGECSINDRGALLSTINGVEMTLGVFRMMSPKGIDLLCLSTVIDGREVLLPASINRYDETSSKRLKRIEWDQAGRSNLEAGEYAAA